MRYIVTYYDLFIICKDKGKYIKISHTIRPIIEETIPVQRTEFGTEMTTMKVRGYDYDDLFGVLKFSEINKIMKKIETRDEFAYK